MYKIKLGSHFVISGNEYVFCCVYCINDKIGVSLIDIHSGDRWSETVKIKNTDRTKHQELTDEQINKLFGSKAIDYINNKLTIL